MDTNVLSGIDHFRTLRDAIAGLVAVALIIFWQQMVGPAVSLGISKTTAIWVIVPVGEVVSVLFLAAYLRSTSRTLRSFVGSLHLRWWEVTLLPVGLFLLGQLSAQAGNLLFTRLFGLTPDAGRAGAAVIPRTAVQYAIAILGILFGGAVCEEFIFRSYVISTFGQIVPRWTAAVLALLLFGAIHITGFGWFSLITLAFWAIPVTIYVMRSGKLIPGIIAHALNDAIVFLVFLPLVVR